MFHYCLALFLHDFCIVFNYFGYFALLLVILHFHSLSCLLVSLCSFRLASPLFSMRLETTEIGWKRVADVCRAAGDPPGRPDGVRQCGLFEETG